MLLYTTLCAWAFFIILNKPIVAIAMVLSVLVLEQLLRVIPPFAMGTYNIYLWDVLAIIFTAATILRLAIDKQSQIIIRSYPWKLFAVFSAVTIFEIIRGLPHYGQTTIVHAREHIFAVATAAYFSTFRFDEPTMKRVFSMFIIFGIILLGFAYLSWLGLLPRPAPLVQYEGTWLAERVLNRYGCFYAVFVLFILIVSQINRISLSNIFSWVLVISLLAAIILDQVRTMWVITCAGFLILAFKYKSKVTGKMAGALVVFIILIVFLFFYQPQTASRAGDYLYQAAMVFWKPEHTTFSWRMAVNLAYLKQMSLKDYILGVPFGAPVSYEVLGRTEQSSPHNMFIWQIYHLGVFGVIIFYLLQVSVIANLNNLVKKENNRMMRNFFVIFWLMFLCYQVLFLAWTSDPLYPLILGTSISIVGHYENDVSEPLRGVIGGMPPSLRGYSCRMPKVLPGF